MIQFNPRKSYYKNPFGAVARNTDLFLRIKVTGDRPAASAHLILTCDADGSVLDQEGVSVKLAEAELFEFKVQIAQTGLYFYRFETRYQDGSGEQTSDYQLTVYSEGFTTPAWLKSGVMYQIFPDRFARSANYQPPPQNKDYILRDDWGGTPNDRPDCSGFIRNNDFFGGNLRGIMEKLDYLADLGVTVIYLNPIFEAYSNHRYDTAALRRFGLPAGRRGRAARRISGGAARSREGNEPRRRSHRRGLGRRIQ